MSLVSFNNKTRNSAPYFNPIFDSLFNDSFQKSYAVLRQPAVNIFDDENAFHIELAAPGLNKEDFKVELKKDNLSIWVEKKSESQVDEKAYTRKEFQFTSFARSFVLPEGIDEDQIEAKYTDGILKVSIAKQTQDKNSRREILVS
ncbi:MAG: Hsp20/alpha crystallin family protein [Pedobacter sp.]|nr:MAG: Hsp20/alpha crystallin family protein [Pedobacter sp.]